MHTTTQRISDIRGRFSVRRCGRSRVARGDCRHRDGPCGETGMTKPDPLASLLPVGVARYVRSHGRRRISRVSRPTIECSCSERGARPSTS